MLGHDVRLTVRVRAMTFPYKIKTFLRRDETPIGARFKVNLSQFCRIYTGNRQSNVTSISYVIKPRVQMNDKNIN